MAKKKPLVIPSTKCDVNGCTEDAAYGFREMLDVTHSTSPAREFVMGAVPNWCLKHDAEMRDSVAGKIGRPVIF